MKFSRKLLLVSALILPLITAGATQAKAPERRGNEGVQEFVVIGEVSKPEVAQPMSALSEAKGRLIHEAMMKAGLADKPIHEKLIRINGELQAIMEAPKFNRKAFIKKSNEQANLRAQLEKHRAAALASVADKFSPEERKALVGRMPPFFMGAMPVPPGGPMHMKKAKRMGVKKPAPAPVYEDKKVMDGVIIK